MFDALIAGFARGSHVLQLHCSSGTVCQPIINGAPRTTIYDWGSSLDSLISRVPLLYNAMFHWPRQTHLLCYGLNPGLARRGWFSPSGLSSASSPPASVAGLCSMPYHAIMPTIISPLIVLITRAITPLVVKPSGNGAGGAGSPLRSSKSSAFPAAFPKVGTGGLFRAHRS